MRFAFVRAVELDEQTTRPSRTALLSGASPDFLPPNPLSGAVLITVFSVHFQDCQALQALAGSCSPHALAGTDTLLLSARRSASGRDPGDAAFPCRLLHHRFIPGVMSARRLRTRDMHPPSSRCPAELRGGSPSCICTVSRVQVARRRRASAWCSCGTFALPRSTTQELPLGGESSVHRLAPRQPHNNSRPPSLSESHGFTNHGPTMK